MVITEREKIVRHNGPVVAGATLITPAAGVDRQGFRNCCFLVGFGTITAGAVTSLKVQQSDDDGVADAYDDLAGSAFVVGDTTDDTVKFVEIVNPQKRYLKCLVSRATQNSVVDYIIAILSNAERKPVSQGTTTGKVVMSPIEGTA